MKWKAVSFALFVLFWLTACARFLSSPAVASPRTRIVEESEHEHETVFSGQIETSPGIIVREEIDNRPPAPVFDRDVVIKVTPKLPPKLPPIRTMKIDFTKYPDLNDWNLWRETRWYRQHYSYEEFRRILARTNGIPNTEQSLRRIGLGRFPAGTIVVPELPEGRPYDAVSGIRVAKPAVPTILPYLGSDIAETLRTIERNQEQLLSRLADQTTSTAQRLDNISRSQAATLRYLSESFRDLSASVKAIATELKALNANGVTASRSIVTPLPTPVLDTASQKALDRQRLLLAIIIAGLALLGCLGFLIGWLQSLRRCRTVSRMVIEKEAILKDIEASIPEGFDEFIVPSDIMEMVGTATGRPRRVFLRHDSADPSLLVPLCKGNSLAKKNMRNHIRNCPACRQALARRSEQRIHSVEKETASV
jgi:hypothetical protein